MLRGCGIGRGWLQVGSVAPQARPELPWGPGCVMSPGLFTCRMGPAPLPGTGIKGVGQPLGGTESLASLGGAASQVALPTFPWPPGLSFPLCKWSSTAPFASHCPLVPTAPSSHHIACDVPPSPNSEPPLLLSPPPRLLSDPQHHDPCRDTRERCLRSPTWALAAPCPALPWPQPTGGNPSQALVSS